MPAVALRKFRSEILALYEPPMRAARTYQKMRLVLGRLLGLDGLKTTADLTPLTVARFCHEAPEDVGPNTLRGQLGYLSAACTYAVHRGWLKASPFHFRKKADWVREGPKVRQTHHPMDAIARVLAHLEAQATSWDGLRLWALVTVVAFTGLRRDEALRLRVEDVALDPGVLWIRPRRRLKTTASAAPVPLADRAVEVLARWLPRCGSEWVFPHTRLTGPWTGGPIGGRPLDRVKAAAREVGVRGFTFLSLRHSFATHAEAWGLSELMLQRILRHTTPITQWHYRHADLVNLRMGVRSIDFTRPDPQVRRA